jgi:MoaA/NifB/PqqE/SkfB family radical SAM enzyme
VDNVVVVDIELTNRCNADCYFCPRDQTPHQGLMTPEVFEQALVRAVELHADVQQRGASVRVNLCGLGEPLINKHTASFVRDVTAAGLECGLSSNGALLDERRSQELLDGGLRRVFLNVGERGDDYEEIYKLPWARTRDNVVRFVEMARDRCDVYVVLVNHRSDQDHVEEMRTYWQDRGVTLFTDFEIMNRGGALFVDHMQYESLDETNEARRLLAAHGGRGGPVCTVPFLSTFIGYDGNFYLCCSDWKKEAAVGNVAETSFNDVIGNKLVHALTREPVCKSCNLDPVNVLAEEVRATRQGLPDAKDPDALAKSMMAGNDAVFAALDALQEGIVDQAMARAGEVRALIPVRAL